MSAHRFNFSDPGFVAHYVEKGPAAFLPGHAGVLKMAAVLLGERAETDARILVVGAGGGLDTRALAEARPDWRFTGVDPAAPMLELTRTVLGDELNPRVDLLEGGVDRCDDLDGPMFDRNIDRYIAYAQLNGVDPETLTTARASHRGNSGLVPAGRNEALLAEAGFSQVETFYYAMQWQGWTAYA